MSQLVGVTLTYLDHARGVYQYDIAISRHDGASDAKVDCICLDEAAFDKRKHSEEDVIKKDNAPPRKYARARAFPFSKSASSGGARRGQIADEDGGTQEGDVQGPVGEHCVWVHRADCKWEEFCGDFPDGMAAGG